MKTIFWHFHFKPNKFSGTKDCAIRRKHISKKKVVFFFFILEKSSAK